jgi:hypothetical protein
MSFEGWCLVGIGVVCHLHGFVWGFCTGERDFGVFVAKQSQQDDKP